MIIRTGNLNLSDILAPWRGSGGTSDAPHPIYRDKSVTGLLNLGGGDTFFKVSNADPSPLQIDFTGPGDWTLGDRLDASFWASCGPSDGQPTGFSIWAEVSEDSGVSWKIFGPAESVSASDPITGKFAASGGGCCVPIAAPIIRLALQNFTNNLQINPGSKAQGARIKVARVPISYWPSTPTGFLFT